MCLAISHPVDAKPFNREVFERFEKRHPDGKSLTWVEDGKIRVWSSIKHMDYFVQQYKYLRQNGFDMMIHFRKATKGSVCIDNCHPFFVNPDLAFIHNGTISIPDLPDGKSDTVEFRDRILRMMPEGWLYNRDFRDMVNEYSGWSRFVFMNSNGEMFIINEDEGEWAKGSWFSNTTYTKKKKKKSITVSRRRDSYRGRGYKRGNRSSSSAFNTVSAAEAIDRMDSVENLTPGYDVNGYPICDVCITEMLLTRPFVRAMDEIYEQVGFQNIRTCIDCGREIWPEDFIKQMKEGDLSFDD